MPGKRKRSSNYRRPYRRTRRASTDSIVRRVLKAQQDVMPFGDPSSARFQRYGPSASQMRNNPGMGRTAAQSQARIMDRYYGDGGYWQDFTKGLKTVGKWGSRITGAAGGVLGGAAAGEGWGSIPAAIEGGIEGWKEGAKFSKAAGWGSYRVSNDLVSASPGSSAPVYHSTGKTDEMGDVIISNRELVQLVTASPTEGAFKVESFTLNPVDRIFHHLRTTAAQYEQFEFLGLMFEYVPMTGEGGTNELGVIGMAANYDPGQDRYFDDIEKMMRYKGSITTKPSQSMVFGIECDPDKRPIKVMYTRDNVARPANFTDLATFYFGSEGLKANQTLGQLWVTYTCKLRNLKPNLNPTLPLARQGIHFKSAIFTWANDEITKFGTDIMSVNPDDNGETTMQMILNPAVAKKATAWIVVVQAVNQNGVTFNTNPGFGVLHDVEFIPMSKNAGVTTTVVKSTHTSHDSQQVIIAKLRVIGDNPKFQLTRNETASGVNPHAYYSINICQLDDDSPATSDSYRVV